MGTVNLEYRNESVWATYQSDENDRYTIKDFAIRIKGDGDVYKNFQLNQSPQEIDSNPRPFTRYALTEKKHGMETETKHHYILGEGDEIVKSDAKWTNRYGSDTSLTKNSSIIER